MTQPTKPSAGALRAASQFARHSEHIYRWRSEPQDAERELAEIIDRETGVAELLEAAKAALEFLWKERGQIVGVADCKLSEALRQAITKCERSE